MKIETTRKMKNFKYVLMVFAGGSLYGTMSSFVKLSYERGFNAAQIAFFQAFFAAVMLWICAAARGARLRGSGVAGVEFAGCAVGMVKFFYYQSVVYISASLAVVILMQFTWLSLLVERVAFGRRASKTELLAVAFVWVGTIAASGLADGGMPEFSAKGLVFAFASAVAYAVYVVANERAGAGLDWTVKSAVIMTASSAAIFAVSFRAILFDSPFGNGFFAWAAAFAVFGTTLPTALFSAGIPKIGAAASAVIMTVELPVAVLCAAAVLGERVGALQVAGIAAMLFGIALMNLRKARAG